jgi:hypothetical protein
MSALILLALIAGAFALQHLADRSSIAALAAARGWRVLRICWTPWTGASLGSSRALRHYRIDYQDESGRPQQRSCRLACFYAGAAGVELDPLPARSLSGAAPARPLPGLLRAGMGAAVGAFAGGALGILGAFLLRPGSNIAPAYGLLLLTPIGALVGMAVGIFGRRTGVRAG